MLRRTGNPQSIGARDRRVERWFVPLSEVPSPAWRRQFLQAARASGPYGDRMRVASAALVFESDRSTLARACEKIDTWIAEANSETTALSGPSARASAESHGPTLLVVDDEPDIGLMALDILEPAGYIVLHTSNPFEAIWLTRQWPGAIDLSLVDVVMTIMDGRELARRLLILRPQMKVLLMSGYKDSSLAETGWAVIEKPFGIQALTQKVAETLEAGGGRPRW